MNMPGALPGRALDEAMPDPYRTRKWVGLALWIAGMLIGGFLVLALFLLEPFGSGDPLGMARSMGLGALLAFPAGLAYLTFPRLLDRFDPEPLWALALALLWGAVAACGFSAFINSVGGGLVTAAFGAELGDAFSAVVSAPFVEEFWKGIMVLGVAYFLRDQFDGVVDGVIYATFVAIGFAATENVLYYGRVIYSADMDAIRDTVMIRGLLAPWGHPLYTSMTGLGLGLAREQTSTPAKVVLPVVGYAGAVLLHMLWNGSATACDYLFGQYGLVVFLILLVVWLAFVLAFVVLVIGLVYRRGRLIRQHLTDEVVLGHITQAELELVTSVFGTMTALIRKGFRGQEFVRAVARLGLSNWHTARAMKGQKGTVSMDFILPLRAKIRQLRAEGASPGAP
ncbi:MAG: PrsW family intramembrane metalloprotease [Deltaproteobacteria bacterium]